nr:MFS transporter [uncultured Aminipila sp.]
MKLSLKIKTAYGIIAIADQCLYFLYGTFFLFFMTTVVGIDPGIAGVIAALGAVWDAVCSAVIGFISDNTRSRFGKRKVFIIFASVPVAIVTTLLFTAIEATMTVKIVYYVCMTLLFWTGFSSFFIPFLAWGAELTEDYNERTRLRSFAYVGNTLGMAIGAVMPTIFVDHLVNMGRTQAQAWHGTAAMIAGCVFLSLFIGASIIKEPSNNLEDRPKSEKITIKKFCQIIIDMFKGFAEILKLRTLRYAVYASILYLAANTIFVADRLYFYTYNMGLNALSITALMAIEPFAGMVFVPILMATSNKFDKRSQFMIGMSICAVSMIALRFIGVTNFIEAALMLVAFGLGAICYWQLMPAMMYDVCEVDELVSGKQRQGTIVSLQAISESLSEAVGLVLLGNMLQWAGFDGNSPVQHETALFWVDNAFTIIPGVFMFLSVYMIYKYPITKKLFNRVLAAVEKQREGEPVNLEEFKEVI